MKILINAYACSPYQGSEPGMGWNFVKSLFGKHDLYVITECKYEEEINRYFYENPNEKNLVTFYFVKRIRFNILRKIWPPSYYLTYKKWQKDVLNLARELDRYENFDIVHQLNMIGYREPGYLWKMYKPFVWGPIGGFNITPWNLLYTMGIYGSLFYGFRNIINLWQMHTSFRVRKAMKRAEVLMCATANDVDTVKAIFGKDSILMPEVGLVETKFAEQRNNTFITTRRNNIDRRLKLCWSGLHIHRKSLNFLLEALPEIPDVELHVLGDGPLTIKWKKLEESLGLKNVIWHGNIDRKEAINVMHGCDVFIQTSLSDATSTVLLEALSLGLPVIALDHLGFSNVINDNCGIKIKLGSKGQIVNDINSAILRLSIDRKLLHILSLGAIERAKEFSWKAKADVICELYDLAYKKYNS